jgi:sugar phosphate isomerase/epimerase
MRTLSLSPHTVLPCSPLQQIDAAVDAGFDSVGLRIVPSSPTDIDVMADEQLQAQIVERVREVGIPVFDLEVVRVSRDLDYRAIESVLAFGEKVGAKWLASTSVGLNEYSRDDEAAVVQCLSKLGDTAAMYGMGIMLEFMAFRGIQTLQDALRVVNAADKDNVKVTLDALHFFRSGGTVGELAGIDPSIFSCVQLSDGPKEAPADLVDEARQNRLMPGAGALPLAELLSAVPPHLPVTVEVPSRGHSDVSKMARACEAARSGRELLSNFSD